MSFSSEAPSYDNFPSFPRLLKTTSEVATAQTQVSSPSLAPAAEVEPKSFVGQFHLLIPEDFFWIFLSCFLALLANVAQNSLLGKTNAVTTQVAGYSRTTMIVVGSW